MEMMGGSQKGGSCTLRCQGALTYPLPSSPFPSTLTPSSSPPHHPYPLPLPPSFHYITLSLPRDRVSVTYRPEVYS